jgi:hypothetical protein
MTVRRVALCVAAVALAVTWSGFRQGANAAEDTKPPKKAKAETKDRPKPLIMDDLILMLEADNDSGPPPLKVKFTGGIYDEDVVEPKFTWDFADGSALSHERNPTHTFKTPGTYKVQCTVIDYWKRRGVDDLTIEVEKPEQE